MSLECHVCARPMPKPLLELGQVPVLCNEPGESEAEATAALRADIALSLCDGCGYISNSAFDARLVEYSGRYENALTFSPQFARFADALAHELARRHRLAGKVVVEVGCGRGEFLMALCRASGCRGWGFDPAWTGADVLPDGVRIVAASYDPAHSPVAPDFVCARHLLEHLDQPLAFLRGLAAARSDGVPVAAYVEVPNALWMLESGSVWDVLYEHCGYYVPDALARALQGAGWAVEQLGPAFAGQFLGAHVRATAAVRVASEPAVRAGAGRLRRIAMRFAERHRRAVADWTARLAVWRTRGRRVVAWGAGAKGAMFLNLTDRARRVAGVVDVNPRKHGRRVAGTGHLIVPPARLGAIRPDVVIVMNPAYRAEVSGMLRQVGVDARVVCAAA